MNDRTLRGAVAVVGVGETPYYKRGQSPDSEFKLALQAIVSACANAGISPKEVDGFASFSNDRNDASRLAAALGIKDLRHASMQWGGGGGGGSGAVANGAAAIATGQAECVVVFRALAQGQFGRFGQGMRGQPDLRRVAHTLPYGLMSPAQMFAMKTCDASCTTTACEQNALRAISLASYAHAQKNPRAVMYGQPLDEAKYDASRWIVEPFHLFDCCQENDGAAAMVLVSAERARDFDHPPVLPVGCGRGQPTTVRPRRCTTRRTTRRPTSRRWRRGCIEMAQVDADRRRRAAELRELHRRRADEHRRTRLLRARRGERVLPDSTICSRRTGKLPLNTSGGNLAECYMHGLGLNDRSGAADLRRSRRNQVTAPSVSMVISGPMVTPVSACIFGCGGHAMSVDGHAGARICRAGLAGPVAGAGRARRAVLGGPREDEAAAAALQRLRALAVGTGVDLPPLPLVSTSRYGRSRRAACIYSWERVWHPVHPALEGSGSVPRRAGGTAGRRRRADGRQPARRSACRRLPSART